MSGREPTSGLLQDTPVALTFPMLSVLSPLLSSNSSTAPPPPSPLHSLCTCSSSSMKCFWNLISPVLARCSGQSNPFLPKTFMGSPLPTELSSIDAGELPKGNHPSEGKSRGFNEGVAAPAYNPIIRGRGLRQGHDFDSRLSCTIDTAPQNKQTNKHKETAHCITHIYTFCS